MVIDTCFLDTPIKISSLNCFKRVSEWNVIFANQSYKYYDIDNLLTSDTKPYHEEEDAEKKKVIKATLQYHIPSDVDPIPVSSAYGGLAIYKVTSLIPTAFYKTDGHKSFNILVNEKKMFIWPSLVLETPLSLALFYM
jgi:hypothetical protein